MQALSIPDRRGRKAVSLVETLARVAAIRPRPRITVVRTGALGDTILLLPVLQLLRHHMPGAQLTLAGSAWAEALRGLLPFPLVTVRMDDPSLTPLFAWYPARDCVGTGLFSEADAVVLYTASPTADFVRNAIACCRGPVIVRSVAPPEGTHTAEHLAQAIIREPFVLGDLPFPTLRPPADVEPWAHLWVEERFSPKARPSIIHPGSGGRHKQWPPACFSRLAAELGGPIILLEGPADAEACSLVAKQMPPVLTVARATGLSLPRVAALLSLCRLYIGNDSGIGHLAAALGVPTVTVVGPTDPRMWAPLGPRVGVVRPENGVGWPTPDAVLEVARRMEA